MFWNPADSLILNLLWGNESDIFDSALNSVLYFKS